MLPSKQRAAERLRANSARPSGRRQFRRALSKKQHQLRALNNVGVLDTPVRVSGGDLGASRGARRKCPWGTPTEPAGETAEPRGEEASS